MDTQNPAMGNAQPSPGVTQQDISGLREMMMGMSLPQLQQFAQQHMNNPNGGIIVGMASQIANAKKSAQAPQPPQGSVAQQAVAGIAPQPQMAPAMPAQPAAQMPPPAPQQLPENQGIAQLPAKNIEGMAGGGIVDYADGGEIKRFGGGGFNAADDPEGYGAMYDPSLPTASSLKLLRQNNINRAIANATPTEQQMTGAGFARPTMATDPRVLGTPPSIPQQTAINNVPANNPATGTAPATPPNPNAGIAALPNVQSLMGQLGLSKPQSVADNLAMLKQQVPNPETEHTMSLGENVQELKKQAIAMGIDPDNSKAFDRLDKLDEKAQELLDKKQALSIIQGGLGMIKSGNPFMAIAEGAGQGVKSYSDAMDQAQQTQMKLAESRISLDNAKNAMNMGLFSKAVDNQENAQKRNLEYLQNLNHTAAAMTTAQGQNAAMLAGHMISGQFGYAGQHEMAGAMADRANAMMYGADVRAGVGASGQAQRYEQMLLKSINKQTNQLYTPQEAHALAQMYYGSGQQLLNEIPTAGGGKVLN